MRRLPVSARGEGVALGAGDVLGGRYRVRAFLGGGGMAEVYEVEDLCDGGPKAVKVPRARMPATLGALQTEIDALLRVRHPEVARLHAVTRVEALPVAVLELLSPCSLAQRLRSTGAFSPWCAGEICGAVARGLQALHSAGVAHNDVKADNVLFRGATPVLSDLGLASFEGTPAASLSRVEGTPGAMAPELILGKATDFAARKRADQYSLAVLAYECFTGAAPFEAEDRWGLWYAHLSEAPAPPSQRCAAVSSAVDAVLLRGLAKRADERFPSVEAFADALSAAG